MWRQNSEKNDPYLMAMETGKYILREQIETFFFFF